MTWLKTLAFTIGFTILAVLFSTNTYAIDISKSTYLKEELETMAVNEGYKFIYVDTGTYERILIIKINDNEVIYSDQYANPSLKTDSKDFHWYMFDESSSKGSFYFQRRFEASYGSYFTTYKTLKESTVSIYNHKKEDVFFSEKKGVLQLTLEELPKTLTKEAGGILSQALIIFAILLAVGLVPYLIRSLVRLRS